jgi:LysR family glycine cleavage system transcriptional activator
VHVDGHQSYWLVTRPEQDDLPQLALFRDWLQHEMWSTARNQEPSASSPDRLASGH